MQVASSLTFTSLLALVPILTVVLTVISAFGIFSGATAALRGFILGHLVPASADVIVAYTDDFVMNAGRLTAFGIAFLAVTSVLLVLTIDRAFNTIWRVERPRPFLHRVVIYVTLVVLGPIVAGASLSLTSWLVGQALGLTRSLQGVVLLILTIMPIVLTSAALTLLYKIVPNDRVTFRDALIGAVIAALVFEAAKRAFATYVAKFATYHLVYGAFAAVPVFLLWIYVSWLIVIFGAVVVSALPEWRARGDTVARPADRAVRSRGRRLSRN